MSCRIRIIAYNLTLLHHYSVPTAVSLLDSEPEDSFTIHMIKTSNKDTVKPEMLSKMWNKGLPTDATTLTTTTHNNIRSNGLLSRRFKTYQSQLQYK